MQALLVPSEEADQGLCCCSRRRRRVASPHPPLLDSLMGLFSATVLPHQESSLRVLTDPCFVEKEGG